MTSSGQLKVVSKIICGPPASGKTAYLLRAYAQCVRGGRWDAALYLVPTVRVADLVRGRMCQDALQGLFDFRVMTFAEAADALLVANHARVAAVSALQQQSIVRRIVEQMNEAELGPLATQRAGPGLITCLVEDINELKAAGVHPDRLLATFEQEGIADPVALAMVRVYKRYQDFLRSSSPPLFDGPGMLWQASEQLDRALKDRHQARPFDTTRLVLADGFSDFTTVELDMLERLAAIAGECIVSLTYEPGQDDARPELQAIPRRTLDALRERLGRIGEVQVETLHSPAPADTDLAYLRRYMFDRSAGPRTGKTHADSWDGSVTVMQAPGPWAEVRMVAREVKRLITSAPTDERLRPGQIGIIARSLDDYRTALRQVFAEYGLPLFLAGGEPAIERPCVRFVSDLLRLIEDDYPRVATVAVLDAAWDKLANGDSTAGTGSLADYVSRQAGITGGAEIWRRNLDSLVGRLDAKLNATQRLGDEENADDQDEDMSRRHLSLSGQRRLLDAAQAVLKAFHCLHGLLAALSAEGTRAELTAHLLHVLGELGVADRLDVQGNLYETAANRRAWAVLLDALRAYAEADRHLGALKPEIVSPEVFAAEVREILQDLRVPVQGRGEGKILALDVHGALQVTFDTVFILGLTEGSFPRRAHTDPLLPDPLRARLAQHGIPVRPRLSEADEEAYLFQLAVSTAARRLYLCYSDTDAAGQPILRSYYLDEAERLLPALKDVSFGLRQLRLRDVVPKLWDAASYRELAERVVWLRYNAAADDAPLRAAAEHLLSSVGGTLQHALTAAEVERLRSGWTRTGPRISDQPPLGPYDACLGTVPAIAQALAEIFGPHRVFSASSLAGYGKCPMAFMFERVFGIEELPEPSAELEPASLGTLLHRILKRFYTDRVAAGKGRVSGQDSEAAWAEVLEAARGTFLQFERDGQSGHDLLWPFTQEAALNKLRIWLEAEAAAPEALGVADLKPALFEHSYGDTPETALVVETEDAGQVRIRGRIDRIDLVGDDGFFLFDYKTGSTVPESREILEGRDFQMPLYARAGECVLFRGAEGPTRTCKGWAYMLVGWPPTGSSKKAFDSIVRAETQTPDGHESAVERLINVSIQWVGKHVAGIRQGRFVWPEGCPAGLSGSCPYKFICRYEYRKALRRRMVEQTPTGPQLGSTDDDL